ncbi:MAG: xanthine dehydrogenase family protein subunit M [Reyranella sp.]|uniref:FAD binding domain-containing protein n=1 Tax=Reyranella sp. TaxID=1929291 RepID=UPI003D1389A5
MGFDFHQPDSVAGAIALAQRYGEAARFIAGGTDLIIQINRKRLAPQHLVSLSGLGLDGIRETPHEITIGAMTTHNEVVFHPGFRKQLVALAEASAVVGGRQIRHVATVGGNIVNASPAADVVPALLVLDAIVDLQGSEQARSLPLDRFLLDRGRTERQHDEILTAVRFARPPAASATAFLKAGRRKAMEISVVCVAAHLGGREDGEGFSKVRIAVGAAAPRTFRASAAEALIAERGDDGASFAEAGRLAAEAALPIGDVRASARYRRLLVAALVERALATCRDRMRGAAV